MAKGDKPKEEQADDSRLGSEVLRRLGERLERVSTPPKFNPQQHKDETRANIALTFTWGFFFLVTAILVGAPIYNLAVPTEKMLDVKDLLNAVSGVIGVPFGFVVGYYFKGSEEK